MKGDVSGVRITPNKINFLDTQINTVYTVNITVKNISTISKSIRYYAPQTKKFRLKVKNLEAPVAPGLEVSAVIEYETAEAVDAKDRVVVTVDGDVIEVPLHGEPARPNFVLETPADFGNVVLAAKTIQKEIMLCNKGAKAGNFKISYTGDEPVSIIPSSGSVPAHSEQPIRVEYVTRVPGSFYEEAQVELQGQPITKLPIKGCVVERTLELLDQDQRKIECLRFGATYYGTDRTEWAYLYNNSPEPVNFVCVLDENAVGQELGVDLTMSTAATLAQKMQPKNPGQLNEMNSLVSVVPNEGVLNPYDRMMVCFRFSPRWTPSKQGFACSVKPPPRQDFAIFIRFLVVGAKEALAEREQNRKENMSSKPLGGLTSVGIDPAILDVHAEVALMATALPVLLSVNPIGEFNFGDCPLNERVDTLCSVTNSCNILPVNYQFRRIAHFRAHPASGKINPGKSENVIFSFQPNQIGQFKVTQFIDVLGEVADYSNPFLAYLEVINSTPVFFVARCDPESVSPKPRLNLGITPKLTNEVGLNSELTFQDGRTLNPKGALAAAQKRKLLPGHRSAPTGTRDRGDNNCDVESLIAFPNDRYASIRPSDRKKKFKTIFTRTGRHNYADPDYSYTDEEMAAIEAHKKHYKQCIDNLREERREKVRVKEHKQFNDDTNIGIKVAAGLKPKKLLMTDIKDDPRPPTPPNSNWKLTSTNQLEELEQRTVTKPVCDGLKAIPQTDQEKRECSAYLTPSDLHKIVIGPAFIDFNDVCMRSINTKHINIVNNMESHIHVQVTIDCRELRQTSPLSQVIPPMSKAAVPVIFESATKGKFQRSINYSINSFYKNHLTVMANVVPPMLDMNTDLLEVGATAGLPAEAGMRSIITLTNPLNYPADFTWYPMVGERGTAFSIRPASGTVEAHQQLDCEVVFHPSYLAPDEGKFSLKVHGGATKMLDCKAKFGATNVQFIERRVMFGVVPLNLTTTKSALLFNESSNHAYFQVLDPVPFQGLVVTPVQGIVPVGGKAELKIILSPNALIKFDTRIQVAIRGWKTLELRVGGSVEPPCVDIDLFMNGVYICDQKTNFNLGGVHCNSKKRQEFRLLNRTKTKTRCEFDLTRYKDFGLEFPSIMTPEDLTYQARNPGRYCVLLNGEEQTTGYLVFTPTEVAAYDFVLPVSINSVGAPTPTQTPVPPTPAPSNKNTIHNIINPKPIPVSIATPRKRVICTALRQPLQISSTSIDFTLTSDYYDIAADSGANATQCKKTMFANVSDRVLEWSLDLDSCGPIIDDGHFRFVRESGAPFISHNGGGVCGKLDPGETFQLGIFFCPETPKIYRAKVPVIIDGDVANPFLFLALTGELERPMVTFEPNTVMLTPVPLGVQSSAKFTLSLAGYRRAAELRLSLPEVECEDGSLISPLIVKNEDGSMFDSYDIQPCQDINQKVTITLKIKFESDRPLSFQEPIVFEDSLGNKYPLKITATADNSLLTCYPFVAQHRMDHQIVCEEGKTLRSLRRASASSRSAGEPVITSIATPTKSRPSTSATVSQFEASSSSYESEASMDSDPYDVGHRKGAVNKAGKSDSNAEAARRSLGSAMFPDEESEEGIFHQEVLYSVQRWFSAHGWPGGSYPIRIPESLRSGVTKSGDSGGSKGGSDSNNLRKDLKTIYDMVVHLAGRPIPGIPMNGPLPSDPSERVKQVYWQHNTMLTFIKNQGGCIASVHPEYLMEPRDYKHWRWLREVEEAGGDIEVVAAKGVPSEEEVMLDDAIFEAVSKRAWTDVLLQLWKTLVLSRITPRQLKSSRLPDRDLPSPDVNVDPLCSNIYSVSERIVLAWMNDMYSNYKERVWSNNQRGGVPNSRWLVNYDYDLLDGLVLGACLGAYCPFLITTHLNDMYTKPETAEQCLHNAIKVVNAMRYIGLDYDIQAIDITDPNPIALMMLSVYFYQKLPLYLPKSTVTFVGSLHQAVQRQIKLSNPSNTKALQYQPIISGKDCTDFKVHKEGNMIIIPPKGQVNMSVEFKSRFLRPAEAMLILVGHRVGSASGTTMVFKLVSQIDDVIPLWKPRKSAPAGSEGIIREESACYELHKIEVDITNPFDKEGEFKVVTIETMEDPEQLRQAQQAKKDAAPKSKKKNKKVRSKINHGQKMMDTPSPTPQENIDPVDFAKQTVAAAKSVENLQNGSSKMSAFFCPSDTVHLKANETRTIQLHFLPFNLGKYSCSLILMNEDIGEFLYTVEAKAVYPQVSALPFKPGPNSVRISSAAAASDIVEKCGRGLGQFGGRDDVIYWKCEEGQILEEVLTIPMTNIRREEALITAAHQQMTEMEYERRRVTGTLNSSTITTKAVELLTVGGKPSSQQKQPKARHHKGTQFTITLDSKYYSAPTKINLPHPNSLQNKQNAASSGNNGDDVGMVLDDGTIELPIKFTAEKSGHYPCKIILEAADDIRVYQVECTVNPPGCSAQIELSAPVHQSVIQNIPIINTSKHDWYLEAIIQGMGFFGPPSIIAKAMQMTTYPLTFRPAYEAEIDGSLILENKADCHEHTFDLIGKSTEPLPLDKIMIKGAVNRPWSRVIDVPNVTKKKLVYRVETDLSFLGGKPVLTVLEGQLGKYELTALPRRRGKFNGVVSFVAGKNPLVQYDSDGDEIVGSDNEDDEYNGYKVWYGTSCDIAPAPPERNISIKCNCQKRAIVEIGVNNPTDTDIKLEVEIHGMGLSGDNQIIVPAKGKAAYELVFFPTCIGETKGSIIFYHDATGEFWYDIDLIAENPSISNLKQMVCELGRWTQQSISLTNPTDRTLEFVPTISNANNFSLERDDQRPIAIKPGATVEVPLNFMPSSLGEADHRAKITFHSEEFGEWVFTVTGKGTLPQPQEPVSLSAPAGANTTVIIPFRNPLDCAVSVDVVLTDKDQQYHKIFHPSDLPADSPFRLLLKKAASVRIGPKSTIEIPISFAPEEMRMYEALCVVCVRSLDGTGWKYTLPLNEAEDIAKASILPRDELYEIKWLYPIHGVTEAIEPGAKSAVLECQARSRVEERLEVSLTGVAPSAAGQTRSIKARAVTPKGGEPAVPDGVVVAEGILVAKQFSYHLEFVSAEQRKALEHCVALSLVRQQRDNQSGLVTLVFNIVYAPYIQMRYDVMLVIKSATGGIWKFPVRFIASEPTPDDTITLEAAGLNKTSSVGIRLTSQTKSPTSYQAYLLGTSDREFSVSPSSGELPPVDNQGTLLIVSFTPNKYGKVYRGKLVVQTCDMQWTYDVIGTLPDYTPPRSQASKTAKGIIERSDRKNFVLDNLRLTTTAVSSPMKGAPVVQRKSKYKI